MTSESARSMPDHSGRHSGRIIAEPAIAASTCSHRPCAAATVAIGSSGSNAVVVVVPQVATTAHGRSPAATSAATASASASGRMAWRSSVAITRMLARPKPASSAAFSTELWLCAETYTTSGAVSACSPARTSEKSVVRSRAHSSATSVQLDAVSWMTPLHASDRPTICRIQSVATSSTSVRAGLDCHDSPSTPRPVLR